VQGTKYFMLLHEMKYFIEVKALSDDRYIPKPKTKFLRVKCPSCGNEQNIFSAPSTKVKCLVCDHLISESGASKGIMRAGKVLKVLD